MSETDSLLSIINESYGVMQAELKANHLPEFWVTRASSHPADGPEFLPSPKLYEARRILLASLRMMEAAIQPPSHKIVEAAFSHQESSALTVAIKYDVAQELNKPHIDQEKGVAGAALAEKFGLWPDEFSTRSLSQHTVILLSLFQHASCALSLQNTTSGKSLKVSLPTTVFRLASFQGTVHR